MGTDIHTIAQINRNGTWETVAHTIGNEDRNYDTFAVLADVRNGSGFAGCDTGEGWHVLFPQRGLPDGVSVEMPIPEKNEYGEAIKYLGDHSYSWLTMKEIMRIWDYFKNEEYEIHGVISIEANEALEKRGEIPSTWSGWRLPMDGYVEAKWKVPAKTRLHLLANIISHLGEIAEKYSCSFSDVRLVFGFDS